MVRLCCWTPKSAAILPNRARKTPEQPHEPHRRLEGSLALGRAQDPGSLGQGDHQARRHRRDTGSPGTPGVLRAGDRKPRRFRGARQCVRETPNAAPGSMLCTGASGLAMELAQPLPGPPLPGADGGRRGGGSRFRRRPGPGRRFLGQGTAQGTEPVAAAVRRELGAGGPLSQDAQRARQRPQYGGVLRRAGGASRGTARLASAARGSAGDALLSRRIPGAAGVHHRTRSFAPADHGGAHPAHAGGAARGAPGDAGAPGTGRGRSRPRARGPQPQGGAPSGVVDRPPIRDGDRGELLPALHHLHGLPAQTAVDVAVRRRGIRACGKAPGNRRRRGDHLRALSPQPHGLSAAVVRHLSQGLCRAARCRRRKSQSAGDRAIPAQGRRVFFEAQLQGAPALRRRIHQVSGGS